MSAIFSTVTPDSFPVGLARELRHFPFPARARVNSLPGEGIPERAFDGVGCIVRAQVFSGTFKHGRSAVERSTGARELRFFAARDCAE
ncbi:hypothetical protein ABT127_32650 [Streptomyces sp. NPDC001904]|uniref:hypothetical protein n=1 Tax=Streptomyces sp. NPDC001904 TaxID=3154531 RepID=UPI00331DEC29